MPYLIHRMQAIDEINAAIKAGDCLACSLLASTGTYVLRKGKFTTVVLSRYPRTWGQTMILLNAHKISVSELTTDEWVELSDQIRKTTIVIEKALNPLRCYIASLGATENLPNTCPHLHFNVLPIYNADDKPSDIFTWRDGVYAGEEHEWENLFSTLKSSWDSNILNDKNCL